MIFDLAARTAALLPPETAHAATLKALKLGLGPVDAGPDDPGLAVELSGMQLPNCIGLAAGFDKNAEVPDAMLRAGFGFVECGSVTPLPQAGNPRPRLFRLRSDRAVINRMGFNNDGLEAFAGRLERRPRRGVVGANIGANKDSEDRAADYIAGLRRLWPHADYFTVNISSPNTPGLRALQGREALQDLLGRVAEARRELSDTDVRPVFVKVAPDLEDREIDDICATAEANGVNGLIVGNTTVSRPALRSGRRGEAGGLSGEPLMALSTETLRRFHSRCQHSLVLIGCGGIASAADVYEKVRAGACGVQLYTAMVYGGPGLIWRIKRQLARRLRADGFVSVVEAVGAG
ncbi:MAG TPA: quinone-dependent dihydroorotate dehydrogenase [Caulobacteraceae bacterium]|jgi:dihydroorotate dehydrogenase